MNYTKKVKELESWLINDKSKIKFNLSRKYLEYRYGDNQNDIGNNIKISIGNLTQTIIVNETSISCGIRSVYNLPYDGSFNFDIIKKQYRNNFYLELYKEIFRQIKIYSKTCFLQLSNNNSSHYGMINNILDRLCVTSTEWKRNPNSDNLIKIWII